MGEINLTGKEAIKGENKFSNIGNEGATIGNNMQGGETIKQNMGGVFKQNNVGSNGGFEKALPTKVTVWSKIKSILLKEIKVELTPAQQEFEDRMNEILHQDVTLKKVHDFLFQEIKFGKNKK